MRAPIPLAEGSPPHPPSVNQGARRPLGATPPVSPNPGRNGPHRSGPHPRFRHPSISLQLRYPRDENRFFPGPHRPARCGNPNPTRRSLIGWGAWSESNPGRIGPHPRFRIPSISLQLRHPGGENGSPPGWHRPARCGNPNPAGRSLIG